MFAFEQYSERSVHGRLGIFAIEFLLKLSSDVNCRACEIVATSSILCRFNVRSSTIIEIVLLNIYLRILGHHYLALCLAECGTWLNFTNKKQKLECSCSNNLGISTRVVVAINSCRFEAFGNFLTAHK